MSESPPETTPDTPTTDTTEDAPLSLEGFTAEMVGPPDPEMATEVTPSSTEAVEASEVEETTEVVEADKTDEVPAETKDGESDAETKVNFDGFSDDQKATWERLHGEGHATPEEIETARLESLRQSDYTKKTMALAEQRKTWEAETAQRKADLELLDQIRADEALQVAWQKMTDGETATDDVDGEDLVDVNTAREIAAKEFAKLQAEKQSAETQVEKEYRLKEDAIRTTIAETMTAIGVDEKVMQGYLETEGDLVPAGVDPIANLPPEEWQRRLLARHELESAKAEAARLREQLNQKTTRSERTSKQSLPPARAVANDGKLSTLHQTESDLNLAADWSNVQGFGHPTQR